MQGTARTPFTVILLLIGTAVALWLIVMGTHHADGAAEIGSDEAAATTLVSQYGEDVVAYATVRRSDGTYRRMLVSKWALEPIAEAGSVPEGTRILMETYYRPGVVSTVFHARKSGSSWRYGSFQAANPDLATRSRASCLSCHAEAADTDLVFTLPSLFAFAAGGGASDFVCERGGRSPCDGLVYQQGVAQ